jgi:hypothetical protein
MGTTHEWLRVLISGTIYGAVMSWALARKWAKFRWLEGSFFVIAGLAYGVATTFGSRALHPPLLFVSVGVFAGMLIIGLLMRRNKSRPPVSSSGPSDSMTR